MSTSPVPDQGKAVQAALTALVLDQPFFGVLALRLKVTADPSCKTAWTDGVTLGYNPAFVAGLTRGQLQGLLCHEVLHCAQGHVWRRDERDPQAWNVACDHEINPLVTAAGMSLPPGGLPDPQFAGLSAEAIYPAVYAPKPPPQDGDEGEDGGQDPGEGPPQPGDGDPGGCGEVRDSPDPGTARAEEAEWQAATLQAAAQAQARGNAPAGMERLVERIKKPACRDLVAALLEHVQRAAARENYSWRTPNRRFVPFGLYLPSLEGVSLPPVAAAVDTSGSINPEHLATFAGALQVILDECRPEVLHVLACDAAVKAAREFLPGDLVEGDYPGGGGTDFRPVFDHLSREDTPPCCAVYLTDLEGCFPDQEPEFPVIWVVSDKRGRRPLPPFGSVLYLE